MTLIRVFLIFVGCFCLALGTLGMFLPVLPTVPLYLLATICFAKSSMKLHRWFTGTNVYKKNLESYLKGQGMTLQTKYRIALTITLSMAVGAIVTNDFPWVIALLALIWMALMLYFFVFVKTESVK